MSTASLRLRLLQAIVLLFVGTLVACSEPTASQSEEAVSAASQQTETQLLNTWLDEQYAEQLETRPMTKTSLGDKTDYGQLDDFSLAAEQRDLEWLRESVATMLSEFDYAQLTDDGKLSYDMWKFSLERAEAGVPYRQHGYIFGRGGPHAYLPNFLINFHRVDTIADLDAYVSRLRELDRVFAELLERSQAASAAGIRQPRFGYDFALAEIERVTAGAPFSNSDSSPNSPLWTDLQSKTTALIDEGLLSAEEAQVYFQQIQELLAGEVKTAYEEVAAWLREDRELASEEAQGVWALPDGEAFYNYRLAQMTTVELTAEEIHQIGLDEVARIQAEMEAIKQQVGFDGSLQEFFTFMREDEQFYFPNTDEGRQAYLDLNNKYLDAIALKLPDYFGRLPKAALEVRRVEAFREQAGAAQHYSAGTPDGSRPGVFYSHMSDMSTLPIFQLEDVAYHEGSPGHHMQISIQQELEDVPRFRTQYRTTAYTEGWGLYSEWLAKEMGGFEDPYSDFGRLGGEIWRAIRLVVDTGIHSKRWTEEEAVQYFLANSPQAEGAVRSEIKRYIATPGQATAYKIGMLKIQEVRRNAEQALGEAFDIREFHDIVLGAGALPLPLLEARVNRWISESL